MPGLRGMQNLPLLSGSLNEPGLMGMANQSLLSGGGSWGGGSSMNPMQAGSLIANMLAPLLQRAMAGEVRPPPAPKPLEQPRQRQFIPTTIGQSQPYLPPPGARMPFPRI